MPKNSEYLLTDCDNVLINWGFSFEDFVKAKKHNPLKRLYEVYDIPSWLNISPEEVNKLVKEFNDTHLEHLPYFDDVPEFITTLSKNYKIIVVTAIGLDKSHKRKRIKNLEKHFGNLIHDVQVVDTHASKEDILKRYNTSYWFDDHYPHAITGHNLGHHTFLVDRFDNHSTTELPSNLQRITSLSEFLKNYSI